MPFFCTYQGFGARAFLARLRPWFLCRRCRARRIMEVAEASRAGQVIECGSCGRTTRRTDGICGWPCPPADVDDTETEVDAPPMPESRQKVRLLPVDDEEARA